MTADVVHGGAQSPSADSREGNLDLLKGLGAVAVVLLHAPPLYHSSLPFLRATGWALREICQIAVPLFFLVSGYLAGRRNPGLPGGARTLRRIASLYIPWFLLYLSIDLLQEGRDVAFQTVLRRFLGLGVDGASTSGYHLWFLPAMFWGMLVVRLSCRWFGSALPSLALGAGLYALVGWSTFPDAPLPWDLAPHEGINLSLLFLSLGHVHGRRVASGGGSLPFGPVLPLLSIAWLLAEGYALGRIGGTPLLVPAFQSGRILLPCFLLVFATSSGTWARTGIAGRALDGLAAASTGIYVLHLAILETVPWETLVPNGFLRDNLCRWTAAVAVPVFVTKLALRKGPRFLRILFA